MKAMYSWKNLISDLNLKQRKLLKIGKFSVVFYKLGIRGSFVIQ